MIGKMRDMENVADHQTYELLPAGEYLVEIIQKEDSKTKDNQDPMINIVLEVHKGDFKGRRLYDRIILSENELSPAWKIRWRAKMFLKAIGEEHKGNVFEWDSDRWVWRRCWASVVQEEQKAGKYAGTMRNAIKSYTSCEEEVGTEVSPGASAEAKTDADYSF